jgi:outer membrane protein OmpA-like peptidoglycan-associated protein
LKLKELTPAPKPSPAPEKSAPQQPAPQQLASVAARPHASYLVFFDADTASVTPRGQQIIAEAAKYARATNAASIEVNAYEERMPPNAVYERGLSIRRAQTVASELVKNGVPRGMIRVQGFGAAPAPLVDTPPGTRNPQDRRVEILLR